MAASYFYFNFGLPPGERLAPKGTWWRDFWPFAGGRRQ